MNKTVKTLLLSRDPLSIKLGIVLGKVRSNRDKPIIKKLYIYRGQIHKYRTFANYIGDRLITLENFSI